MAQLNSEWALRELHAFIDLTRLVAPPSRPNVIRAGDYRRTAAPAALIVPAAQVVEQILDRVLPAWRATVPVDESGRWQQHHEASQRAIVALERADEVRQMLGDDAPTLEVGSMHPWVWDGARSMWHSNHFRQAVFDAGRRVNAEAQNKYGTRNLTEAGLFIQAFSNNDPTATQPRLRLPDDDGATTAQSVRRGIREFATGCFAAIRNPQAHDDLPELPEHEAIEQLAAFSILARWVDRAVLVTV